jgi:aldehyde dehydrogenase (NAD+)
MASADTSSRLNTVVERPHLYIDGAWVTSEGGEVAEVRSPADRHLVGHAALGAPADIGRAVDSARRSFDSRVWQDTPAETRAAVLATAADLLEERSDYLADLITSELGCTRAFSARSHVPNPIRHIRTFADLIRQYQAEEVRSDGANTSLVTKQPAGVVAAITPWNGPLSGPALKIAPALAAGCSVVAKPPPETPLVLHELADALAEAGLPAGVLNVVPGGREAGMALAAHPQVDKVAFTGSTAAGKHISKACADRIARVTLELGGKSAAIVLPDADVAATVSVLVPMAMTVNGQLCIAQSRVLVHQRLYEQVVAALAAALSALRVGDPMDPATDLGPMVSEAQRDRVESYIRLGQEEGGQLVTGGSRPAGLDGWFVSPTLVAGVTNDMRIAREEVFGPVMAVIPFTDSADAIRLANDSPYGLSGSVWGDPGEALAIARRIRTGMVSINGAPQAWGTPFGGFKQSGIGREMGPEGLEAYFEVQSIAVRPGR